MAYSRYKAINLANNRPKIVVENIGKISNFFGNKVFGEEQMKELLSSDVFKKVKNCIDNGLKIDPSTADSIASATKIWAIQKGATHFTHWFQPLTGSTAEKHDTFFDSSSKIEKFKGVTLTQQEPDASSFPNGGIRSTVEARGYTAWDPSSPMFIYGATLCIPTVFVSYTGEALDTKAPLLKTLDAIDIAATKVCQLFDKNVTKVKSYLGCEQEYFVIDKALYLSRPDLVMTGRTVFGHKPARGQQLDDHYFGSIPSRVYDFMKDFEKESLKLGIPVSTRHNEVAPSQFEVAPLFEEMNIAVDHNQLLMNVMSKVAENHKLKVLFHEKPFAGVNGSGKHSNWSLITNNGINLFQPSPNPKDNLLFLTFLVITIKAVYEHDNLLRASIASASNDHRLGANEAPPAIMSVFLGTQLTKVLDELENKGNIKLEKGENLLMKLGIDNIPHIILDNTDRNRTSPLAFTGNKFEFRAVGSMDNPAISMLVLNAIVANQLNEFYEEILNKKNKNRDLKIAIVEQLRSYIKESKKIRFEGDGYSDNWSEKAKTLGLSNIKSTPLALDAYLSDKSRALFRKLNILSEIELEARNNIRWENYILKIQIESRVIGDLVQNHIIPTAISYQNKLIKNARGLKKMNINNNHIVKVLKDITQYIITLENSVAEMTDERKIINQLSNPREKAIRYSDDIKLKYFDKIRYAVDKLELIVDDKDWPLSKYREMLFMK